MKPEQRMWQQLKEEIAKDWKADRHEDRMGTGVPDVSWATRGIQGWTELKYLAKWPTRPETTIKLKHFTIQQKLWLLERDRYARTNWFLLKVGRNEWLLFEPRKAFGIGGWTQLQMRQAATVIWIGLPSNKEFIDKILSRI